MSVRREIEVHATASLSDFDDAAIEAEFRDRFGAGSTAETIEAIERALLRNRPLEALALIDSWHVARRTSESDRLAVYRNATRWAA